MPHLKQAIRTSYKQTWLPHDHAAPVTVPPSATSAPPRAGSGPARRSVSSDDTLVNRSNARA